MGRWLITFERLHIGSSYLVERWGTPTTLKSTAGRTEKSKGVDLIIGFRANCRRESKVDELMTADDGRRHGICLASSVWAWPAIFFRCAAATIFKFYHYNQAVKAFGYYCSGRLLA
jgi:hypothetical protein